MATELTTDQLAAAFLASLEADAARIETLDRLHVAKYGRRAGQVPLHDAGRAVVHRIVDLCGIAWRDMSHFDHRATFSEGRAAVEAAIARLSGE